MAKLSINVNPTFPATVTIPVAGGDPVDIGFVFKHRTKTQVGEFTTSRKEKTDVESVLEMVEGWDFAEPFTPEAVEIMLENYYGAAEAIYRTYLRELVQAKTKN